MLDRIINQEAKQLPNADEIYKFLSERPKIEYYDIMGNYRGHCFPILSHEFMVDMKEVISEFTPIIELAAGEGWLSHWAIKYGVPIAKAVDNKTWKFKEWLPSVETADAVETVKKHSNCKLFIVSWPYMDDMAYNIWKMIIPGQYLLYIGEGWGGCTADDKFHDAVQNSVIGELTEKISKHYLSFCGIYDTPVIYKK